MAPFKSTQSFSVGTFLKTFRNRDAVGDNALNSPVRTDNAALVDVLEEYVYAGQTLTTLSVARNTKYITFAGIGEGGTGDTGYGGGTPSPHSVGGGGGAANLAGYTIGPTGIYEETTLYIGVGYDAPTYVRTDSHTGPIIFELNRGTDGSGGGGGGAANPTYSSVAGGDGGTGGNRFDPGTNGTPATNSGGGGGGGGGYGDASPVRAGGSGGSGGSVTMSSPPNFIAPNGGGPASAWTIGPAGGWDPAGNGNGGGSPGSGSGAQAAAGVTFNSVAYGGGGGGGGGAPYASNAGGAGGPGMSGFLIVQLRTLA